MNVFDRVHRAFGDRLPHADGFENFTGTKGQRDGAIIVTRLARITRRDRFDHADPECTIAQCTGEAGTDEAATYNDDVELFFHFRILPF